MQEFILIVAGSRGFKDYVMLSHYLNLMANEVFADKAVSIMSGMAKGADSLAVRFAREHDVKLYERPAQWDSYGKAAGFRRNSEMAKEAHGLLVFWDGVSNGTKHMIDEMKRLGKPVEIVKYQN